MIRSKYILFITLIAFTLKLNAQNVEFEKSNFPDKKDQIKIANDIVENDLSVRETEKLINSINKKIIDKNPGEKQKLLQFDKLPEVEKTVSEYLGTLVKIKVGKKKGTIEILFGSLKDFERIVRRIVTSK